ncbi:MAG: ribosomal RNA small subunit methyltransferase A [Saprospiraceae bacterium]|nr:ribosomal RNA small subunit methyltransferase A [Saprospiraceae bacterium]
MKAKKHLGQHFLVDQSIAQRIVGSLIDSDEVKNIVEVGPGKGMLTKYLLQLDQEVVMIDADIDMVEHLKQQYPVHTERIIHANFLKCNLPQIVPHAFSLIGNFPYYISTQIVFKMLDNRTLITQMVGMFQKEVATRIVSGHGSKAYGILSVLVQVFYQAEYLFSVKPGSFSPPPKVTSAVIRLTRKNGVDMAPEVEKRLRQVVKMAFNQRRKMLRNSLKSILPKPFDPTHPFLTRRPEQMSIDDFLELNRIIYLYANES